MPHAAHHQAYNREPYTERQVYHKPHTSMGSTGHFIKTAGILAPLVIGEFVADPEKKWRYVRMAAIATTLVSEGMWAHKISKEREAAREHELTCHSQG